MKVILTTSTSDVITIDKSKIKSNSYKSNLCDDNSFKIGYAASSSFNFSFTNNSGEYDNTNFKGSTFDLYNDTQTVKIGHFNVDDVTKNKKIISIDATDNMTLFDTRYQGNATFPISIFSFISLLCLQAKITFKNTEVTNGTIMIQNGTNFDGKSLRDLIKLCCELTCSYAIINSDGQLEFKWYDLTTVKKSLTYSIMKDFTRKENDDNITGLSIYVNKQKISKGTDNYELFLTEDNPIFVNIGETDRDIILTNIFNLVNNMTYMQASVKITTDNTINIGDTLICHDNTNNEDYKILVTSISISNDLSETITSSGKNTDSTYSNSSSSSETSSESTTINVDDQNTSLINCNNTTVDINSKQLTNVSTKSSATILIDCDFNSDISAITDFLVYINETFVGPPSEITCDAGKNHYCAAFKLHLITDVNINNIFVKLKSNSNITIEKFASKLTVWGLDVNSNEQGVITNVKYYESIRKTTYIQNMVHKFGFKNINESISYLQQIPENSTIQILFNDYDINNNDTSLTIETINENLTNSLS